MEKTLADKFQAFLDNKDVENVDRTLLIDGHNTYIRSFTTVPVVNENGEHFGGTLGFLRSIIYLIKRFSPTEVIIVFDGRGGSQRRRKLYKGYKAGRRNKILPNRFTDLKAPHTEEESFVYQFRLLGEYLSYLPIKVMAFDNVEADDIIAHIATSRSHKGMYSTIVSSDKDFLQLVSNYTSVYRPIRKVILTPKNIKEIYDVVGTNYLIRRCFEGDDSDEIPGVHGVGHKTLKKLFKQYTGDSTISFDSIFDICQKEISNGSKRKVFKTILDQKATLDLNFKLMQLQDVDIAGTTKLAVDDLVKNSTIDYDLEKFRKLLVRDGLASTVKNFENWINKPLLRKLIK